jgi:hypothetical protein
MTVPVAVSSDATTAPAFSSPLKGGEYYRENGFVVGPPTVPADLLCRAAAGMDEVLAGRYETGKPPLDYWKPAANDPAAALKLRKIDQAHVANRAIYELLTYPAIGRWIAEAIGARMVQIWAVQLLHKPGTGSSATSGNSVGWHQDYYYWRDWYTPDSEVFTCWLAVSDVPAESGPMRFVPRSQNWGLMENSDFFAEFDSTQIAKLPLPANAEWNEVSGIMPPGAFSLHHRLTFHGSTPNRSLSARRSFAVHLRTDRSTPTPAQARSASDGANSGETPPYDYVSYLNDPAICPIIYQAS